MQISQTDYFVTKLNNLKAGEITCHPENIAGISAGLVQSDISVLVIPNCGLRAEAGVLETLSFQHVTPFSASNQDVSESFARTWVRP